jgi:hypothetical protein
MSAPDNRDAASPGVELVGKPAAVRTLLRALAVFPFGRAPRKVLVG